jgi:tetratricopeptide (TPR) repeat protein
MAHKREPIPLLSQQDNAQVQQLLADYHQTAQHIQQSKDPAQVESALAPMNALPENTQIAFLKALAKENTIDAADTLVAVNALSPHKEVRKEARRSLIRLEGAKIYPQWTAPIVQAPIIQVNVAHPPRFWKGYVTRSREEGELQLLLSWEQGYDYADARMLVFLLDYWQAGVKDIIAETGSKRHVEEHIEDMRAHLTEATIEDCTLAEGKRLLEEALTVNAWRGTPLPKEYSQRQSLINSLILETSDAGEDRGRTFINPEMTEQETTINFLGAWTMGDYALAYDLLTNGSELRDGLARDEWIELHRAWFDEAHPTRMELGFVHEREQAQSALWLPTSITSARAGTRKEIEIGWSLELAETPLSGTLKEMPLGTAVNKETGRHWFWTSYTLLKEKDGWRIQAGKDEGLALQRLPIADLQKRVKVYEEAIQEAFNKRETNPQEVMEELSWRLTQLLHFYDALLTRLPLDRQICEDAYGRSIATGNPERSLIYLERLAQRFPENRADTLRTLGATLLTQAYNDMNHGLSERAEKFLERSEQTLREAVAVDDSALSHLLLAEMLLSQGHNEEAEMEYQQARSLPLNTREEAAIEAGFGNIAMRREQLEKALAHFQRVTELSPDYAGIWFNIGFAQRLLGRFDDALEAYRRAIRQEAGDIRPYAEMMAIYMTNNEIQQARAIAEQGVSTNPASAELHALLASVLSEMGDQRNAQRELANAEAIDPDLEVIARVRAQMAAKKK